MELRTLFKENVFVGLLTDPGLLYEEPCNLVNDKVILCLQIFLSRQPGC